MNRQSVVCLSVAALLLAGCASQSVEEQPAAEDWQNVAPLLPEGFSATVFHSAAGPTRQIAVRDNGDVYVARDYRLSAPQFGMEAGYGAILAMRDTDADGVADIVEEFVGSSTYLKERQTCEKSLPAPFGFRDTEGLLCNFR